MAFKRLVEDQGLPYDCEMADSVSQARRCLSGRKFDLVISDYSLGDGTAVDFFDAAPNTPFIVVTGAGNEQVAVKAWHVGAYDYLVKDVDRNYLTTLPIAVENALRHKQTEDKLRLLSSAVMSTDESIFITDMDDKIVFVNKAFCKTYGYDESEIIGKDTSILWITKLQNSNTRSVFRTQTVTGTWQIGFYHKRKNGSIFPVSLSKSIVKDAKGVQVAVVGIVRDISDVLLAEHELRKANAKLKEQNQQKSDLAIAVSQTLERLLESPSVQCTQPPQDSPYSPLDVARQVIHDFLCVSKAAAGRLEPNPTDLDLSPVLKGVLQNLSPRAAQNHIELKIAGLDSPLPVKADHEMLAYALTNIVGASILFAPPHGRLEVLVKDSVDETLLTVQISPPSPRAYPARHADWVLDHPPWRSPDDYPLALTTASRLIEMHGGRLWTENGREKTIICIALPKLFAQEKPKPTLITAQFGR